MEERHQLVGLRVLELVAARVLDESELGVDALADRGRGGLREDDARHVLQLGAARAVGVPPHVGRLVARAVHDPGAREDDLLHAVEGVLAWVVICCSPVSAIVGAWMERVSAFPFGECEVTRYGASPREADKLELRTPKFRQHCSGQQAPGGARARSLRNTYNTAGARRVLRINTYYIILLRKY